MARWMRDLLSGLSVMPRALRYLVQHPSLIPWVLAPMALTVLAIVGAVALTLTGVPLLAHAVLPQPASAGLLALWWLGVGLLTVTIGGVVVVLAWGLGSLLAAPFYDVIAGRVENTELGTADEDFAWRRVLSDAWLSVRHSLLGIALYLAVIVPLFALNLVPLVGSLLYAVLSAVATVFFVSREVMDVPLSRRRLAFRDKLRYLSAHRARVGGHGAVVTLLLLIPLANLLVTPVAVLGATLLFCDIERAAGRIGAKAPSATPG